MVVCAEEASVWVPVILTSKVVIRERGYLVLYDSTGAIEMTAE